MLHVRDIASPASDEQARDVEKVLGSLGFGEDATQDRLMEVWNKVDLLSEDDRLVVQAKAQRSPTAGQAPAFTVSAVTGEGCGALLTYLASRVDPGAPSDIILPAGEGQALAWLYRHGRVMSREDGADGEIHLAVKLDERALGQFEHLFPRVPAISGAASSA